MQLASVSKLLTCSALWAFEYFDQTALGLALETRV